MDSHETNADAIIAIAREAETNKAPVEIPLIGKEAFLTRDGKIISLERYQTHPYRNRAAVDTYETSSFIDYVNRHKLDGATHIFGGADEMGGSFNAVIDYHGQVGAARGPGWGEHECELTLRTTPEWRRWVEANHRYVTQEQFAEFIEDNMTDITTPDAATILEMAQGLQGKKTVQFKSGKNLKDGSIKLEYVETIDVTGSAARRDDSLQVPNKFTLGIVPFIGANGVVIEARLRFRIGNNGALSFAYILDRPYKVIEQAFNVARDEIEAKTGISVILGSHAFPEIR